MWQLLSQWNKTKIYLLLANILLVFSLILLSGFKIIPFKTSDFIFFALLALALALYRPGWAFLFFVGTIALENINLAPLEWGITIRPFQLLGAVTVLALFIRLVLKRINFELARLKWPDYLLMLFVFSGFLGILNAPDKIYSLKLAVILTTFFILYLLVRNYIQNIDDLKKIIPFFLSSAVIVVFYGIWQNWRFMHNLPSFEIMAGRPNATFAEADWLGIYMVLLISVCYSLFYYIQKKYANSTGKISNFQFPISNKFPISNDQNPKRIIALGLHLLLIILFILLILTVSRSAWLGAVAGLIIFLWMVFTNLKLNPRHWQWRKTFKIKLFILSALAASIAAVYVFHLTNFQLFNRIQSTGTRLQKITIACNPSLTDNQKKEVDSSSPVNMESLEKEYGCRHINLEEVESEEANGYFVTEVYRYDPNIVIRDKIYRVSLQEIKKHPIIGIGWGSIGSVLGTDERGVRLNSSNIFLEVWLGAGIIGFLAFLAVWIYIIFSALRKFVAARDLSQKVFNLFLILGWLGLSATNIFNAGLFLGFFWFFLALSF